MNEFETYNECLDFLEINLEINNFSSRIKIQKLAYLMNNLFKWKLDNLFNYYVKGPYSHKLAIYYYSQECKSRHHTYSKLSDKTKAELKRISFIKDLTPLQLEAMASLLWLKNEKHMYENEAEKKLMELKPYLGIKRIWRGSQLLKKFLLTNKEAADLMLDFKEEFEDWDKASEEESDKFSRDTGA